jgi:hypothetical protein
MLPITLSPAEGHYVLTLCTTLDYRLAYECAVASWIAVAPQARTLRRDRCIDMSAASTLYDASTSVFYRLRALALVTIDHDLQPAQFERFTGLADLEDHHLKAMRAATVGDGEDRRPDHTFIHRHAYALEPAALKLSSQALAVDATRKHAAAITAPAGSGRAPGRQAAVKKASAPAPAARSTHSTRGAAVSRPSRTSAAVATRKNAVAGRSKAATCAPAGNVSSASLTSEGERTTRSPSAEASGDDHDDDSEGDDSDTGPRSDERRSAGTKRARGADSSDGRSDGETGDSSTEMAVPDARKRQRTRALPSPRTATDVAKRTSARTAASSAARSSGPDGASPSKTPKAKAEPIIRAAAARSGMAQPAASSAATQPAAASSAKPSVAMSSAHEPSLSSRYRMRTGSTSAPSYHSILQHMRVPADEEPEGHGAVVRAENLARMLGSLEQLCAAVAARRSENGTHVAISAATAEERMRACYHAFDAQARRESAHPPQTQDAAVAQQLESLSATGGLARSVKEIVMRLVIAAEVEREHRHHREHSAGRWNRDDVLERFRAPGSTMNLKRTGTEAHNMARMVVASGEACRCPGPCACAG